MSVEEIAGSVESIEAQAEKVLEDARSKASAIILKSKDDAEKVLDANLSLDEVKKERERIIKQAEQKAEQEVGEAKKKASEIRNGVETQVGKVVDRIVSAVTGAELK